MTYARSAFTRERDTEVLRRYTYVESLAYAATFGMLAVASGSWAADLTGIIFPHWPVRITTMGAVVIAACFAAGPIQRQLARFSAST